jgi:hypothetical protein
MLSTLTGTRLGVSKNINPIIVRLGADDPTTPYSPFEWIRGLGIVVADLGTNSDITNAIVLLATAIPRSEFTTNGDQADVGAFQAKLFAIMSSMIAKGALPVTGAGNKNTPTIDSWPQNLGKSQSALYIEELLVMGGISADGTVRVGKQSFTVSTIVSTVSSVRSCPLIHRLVCGWKQQEHVLTRYI